MESQRIRLGEFSKITGQTKATMRGLLVRGEVPFDPDMKDGSQRTYDGADLLAWCLFTKLRNVGLTPPIAAEAIRGSDVIHQFFQAEARQDDISDLHLIFYAFLRGREAGGSIEITGSMIGTSDDAAAIMKRESSGYGSADLIGREMLGLVSMVTVPLLPCLDSCKKAAAKWHFDMRGPDLFEIEG